MERRTKIVCTIGPASNTPEKIRKLILAGMNIARLNGSHGTHASHLRNLNIIREESQALNRHVAILFDLQGPKIRTGPIPGGKSIKLVEGEEFCLTTDTTQGTKIRVSTTYKNLPNDVKEGDRILMADGVLELRVCRVDPPRVVCEVIRGGMLGSHKGINLPGVNIAEPSLTDKDRIDLDFAIEHHVDFVALSFVRSPEDIKGLKEIILASGKRIGVVAKIERPEALNKFQGILAYTDVVMVARGDLGVEMNFEDIPSIQKNLIHACNEIGVPVITATQMLESMVSHQRPTRAEAADVANAIYDGSDAVMLSGETAAGDYPIEACTVMHRIASKTDDELIKMPTNARWVRLRDTSRCQMPETKHHNVFADAIGQAVCRMVENLNISRIVCFTTTGYTAAAIARYRPSVPITAITNSDKTCRRCAMIWGVNAIAIEDFGDVERVFGFVDQLLLDNEIVKKGEIIIIVAGTPLVVGGRTNLLKLHTIGD